MGLIGRVRSFTRRTLENGAFLSEVQIAPTASLADNRTLTHLGAPGDDSPPLDSDFAGGFRVPGSERFAVGGYVDTLNEGSALRGERRLYGRDAAGAVVCEIHLRRDGSIEIANDAGSFTLTAQGALSATISTLSIGNGAGSMDLAADGTWTLNGAQITPAGDVISLLGRSLDLHVQTLTTPGVGNSGPPL